MEPGGKAGRASGRTMTNSDPSLLQITGLTKRFTGTLALDGVDFDVRRRRGACAARRERRRQVDADQGPRRRQSRRRKARSACDGRIVDPMTEKLPITFIHQDLGLVDTMTVAENIAILAGYPRRHGLISWRAARDAAVTALDAMGGGIAPDARRARPARRGALHRGDRPRHGGAMRASGARRADGGASRSGRGTPAGRAAAPARRRLGHRLCDASAGRGLPHRRSGHRAARRPPHRHRCRGRDDAFGAGPQHRRSLALRALRQAFRDRRRNRAGRRRA